MENNTKFEVLNDIYTTHAGRIIKVFSKGQVCEGIYYEDGSLTAESPYYYDFVVDIDLHDVRKIEG